MVWMTIRRFTNALDKKLNWNLGCSLLLVGVLASAFLFYLWAQNLGKYTLQPGQSISLKVKPRTQDVEYYSVLILKKNDNNKLKLSGSGVWFEVNGEIFYGVEEQKLFKRNYSENDNEELPNNQKGIHLVKDGIVVNYQGEKVLMSRITNLTPSPMWTTNQHALKLKWWIGEAKHWQQLIN